MKTYYITTPLYYVNAQPHIGHAYTNVLCDTLARYRRFLGEKVFFMTGTDEHGSKIEKAAQADGKDPHAYVDAMVPEFKELWRILGIQYDFFFRTTDDFHKKAVGKILSDLEAKGEVYKSTYTGWYCTPCESFWTDLQLKEAKCPDCGREVQQLSEDNFFFRLSKYQDWLIDTIRKNPDFIEPEMRKNEILGFLRQPLEDLCISRARSRLSWGIDYPTSKGHVVYVWFDALVNYISAVGYPFDEAKFKGLWPADVHMVGKDILRQHAVYWPIMLKACGLDRPKTVLAHGWWTLQGAKVSKSRGNAVDPGELVKKYGVDAFRYFLLNEVTLGSDGAFSEDLLAERYTSDLANDLGNLWFRYASMLEKYFEGKIPDVEAGSPRPNTQPLKALGAETAPLQQSGYDLWDKVHEAMLAYDPREALASIWAVITMANQFVEENKPWVLAKDPAKENELGSVLVSLGECIAHVAMILLPFLPHTASQILERLPVTVQWTMPHAEAFKRRFTKAGDKVNRGPALFPRLEDEEKKAEKA